MWKKYIQWEKSNPMETEEYGQFARRVVYAYEQSLLCLGYYPDMWYEAALFLQQAGKQLEEKGDVKLAQQMTAEAMQLFDRAISGLMKHSQLLYFAYADFEEERMKFDNVKKIYDNLLAIDHIDPTLDKDVAMRVFDLGLKKYGDEPEYACAYVDFLTHLNAAPQGASVVMGGIPSVQLEIGGYPRPDIDQMIPFKPKANSAASFHPVPGGVFPPPPAIAELISLLPPPWTFQGPFVSVDLFIEHINKMALTTGPVLDKKVKIENGTMVGPMRVDDVRKDMYQLLATTPDPRFVSTHLMEHPSSTVASSIGGKRKRGESGSDDESRGVPTDIYKRRMDMKAAQH
ncbi:suppressor of forked protein [Teladorsagia circumcincta]|uniref:Suppressor of forked protein n=2 Tax=Teladorsagia circumcincta TaxID=45464 RepID=A0A2G9UQA2_TELCI|nr:suppressor of forked protein [Teladorsagia circumcincta]